MKNHGFNEKLEREHASPTDWVRGGIYSIPCIGMIVESERDKYLPIGENQNIGSEKSDCIARAIINVLEGKFTYLLQNKKISTENENWLRDNGYVVNNRVLFSDRWLAIQSGTSYIEGNSMKAVCDAAHNVGMLPKSLFPQVNDVFEYYDDRLITPEMDAIAKGFLDRFLINYERVWAIHFEETVEEDFLMVAAYAWPTPVNGEYPAAPNYPLGHSFLLYKRPKYYAFDNYIDSVDGDYTKKLAGDYKFMEYGYRIVVTKENDLKKKPVRQWWHELWDWLVGQRMLIRKLRRDLNK